MYAGMKWHGSHVFKTIAVLQQHGWVWGFILEARERGHSTTWYHYMWSQIWCSELANRDMKNGSPVAAGWAEESGCLGLADANYCI